MLKGSIWLLDETLSVAPTPGSREPVIDNDEGVLCITQSSSITEVSPSDCLVS